MYKYCIGNLTMRDIAIIACVIYSYYFVSYSIRYRFKYYNIL